MHADTAVPPVVEMTGITVRFPGVLALDAVDFSLRPGEVHALMGENGAGKSSLIKALTGVYPVDAGSIRRQRSGAELQPARPTRRMPGISTVYQEVNLCANLSVGENVMLGHEPRRGGGIDWKADPPRRGAAICRASASRSTPARCSPATRSRFSSSSRSDARWCSTPRCSSSMSRPPAWIAARSSSCSRSSATCAPAASRSSSSATSSIRSTSCPTASRCCATASSSASTSCDDLPRGELVTKMIGRELDELAALASVADRTIDRTGTPVLRATGIGRRGVLEPADIEVYDGEVVGIAGLLGSGRTELVRLLYGADRAESGQIEVQRAFREALLSATGDREPHRLLVREPSRRGHHRRPDRRREHRARHPGPPRRAAQDRARRGGCRRGGVHDRARRAARRPRHARRQPLGRQSAEGAAGPLAGDGSRAHRAGRAHPRASTSARRPTSSARSPNSAPNGLSVVFISSELEEVLRLAQRVVVMRDRRKIGELDSSGVTIDDLIDYIANKREESVA